MNEFKGCKCLFEIEEYLWSAFFSIVGSLSVMTVVEMVTIAVPLHSRDDISCFKTFNNQVYGDSETGFQNSLFIF